MSGQEGKGDKLMIASRNSPKNNISSVLESLLVIASAQSSMVKKR